MTIYVPLGRSGATEQGIQYLYQLQEGAEMSVYPEAHVPVGKYFPEHCSNEHSIPTGQLVR